MSKDFRELISRAKQGDTKALGELADSVRSEVEAKARISLGEQMRARLRTSDVMQSAYVRMLRDIKSFRGTTENEFHAWLSGIVENTVRDRQKYFDARKRQVDNSITPPETATPSRVAANREDLDVVNRALAEVNGEYRTAIVMRCVESRSHQEIATALGRTVAATRTLVHRARAALAGHIERLRGNE